MTLFSFWYALDTPLPLGIIFSSSEVPFEEYTGLELDNMWTWEGTPEELYSEFQESLYDYEILEIQKEESGYTIWITEKGGLA